jgi:hypothetical protein
MLLWFCMAINIPKENECWTYYVVNAISNDQSIDAD